VALYQPAGPLSIKELRVHTARRENESPGTAVLDIRERSARVTDLLIGDYGIRRRTSSKKFKRSVA
jgi:hypothetical protein